MEIVHDNVDDIYMCATEFMHQGRLLMDENCVGKPQDLHLWCFTLQTQTMRFTSSCRGGVRITEQRNYLTLEIRGNHYPRSHDRQIMNARKSDPSLCGFKSY